MNESELILQTVGAEIAMTLGVMYEGVQLNALEMFDFHLFTDPETGSSFAGRDALHAQKRLRLVRERFSKEEG